MKISKKISEVKQKILSFCKSNKKLFFAMVVCIIVLGYLVFSTFSDINKSKKNSATKSQVSVTEFARAVEDKLTDMISMLDSVSKVSVFVMVDSTPTITYLTETSEHTETKDGVSVTDVQKSVVFEKNGSISTPVVVTTITPKVIGVLIVTNEISASTKLSIINSVGVVLNIDKSCISLLQES